jgi:hypothetical protein
MAQVVHCGVWSHGLAHHTRGDPHVTYEKAMKKLGSRAGAAPAQKQRVARKNLLAVKISAVWGPKPFSASFAAALATSSAAASESPTESDRPRASAKTSKTTGAGRRRPDNGPPPPRQRARAAAPLRFIVGLWQLPRSQYILQYDCFYLRLVSWKRSSGSHPVIINDQIDRIRSTAIAAPPSPL